MSGMRRLSDGLSVSHETGQLQLAPQALYELSRQAFRDISFLLAPQQLELLQQIMRDEQASEGDLLVASSLLRNAVISAEGLLPMCQDTGTAQVVIQWGQQVCCSEDPRQIVSRAVADVWRQHHLRYSQLCASSMYEEQNTGTNLPAQIELELVPGKNLELLFCAKGGGSANKTRLFQETRALLERDNLLDWLIERARETGTSACPPYHMVFVIGGQSADQTLRVVRLAACGWYDDLPLQGDSSGKPFRDRELEEHVLEATRSFHWGAQFGGRHFCHDVRVIRLPRHSASLPIGMGVSCSADRHARARIDEEGVWMQQLEQDPARYLDHAPKMAFAEVDLDQPMDALRGTLARHRPGSLLRLSGTLVLARDLVHAELKRSLQAAEPLPDWFRQHAVLYAGPARTPTGEASGSLGPTTSRRMDAYVHDFQQAGGSLVMIGKGERSEAVCESCREHGGFYLALVGGAAALTAREHVTERECLAWPEFGMEAAWRVRVRDLPALLVIDDKGQNLYRSPSSS